MKEIGWILAGASVVLVPYCAIRYWTICREVDTKMRRDYEAHVNKTYQSPEIRAHLMAEYDKAAK